jgi:MYXO-CTERM domain-containing protein
MSQMPANAISHMPQSGCSCTISMEGSSVRVMAAGLVLIVALRRERDRVAVTGGILRLGVPHLAKNPARIAV